jgi:hypothetical protein
MKFRYGGFFFWLLEEDQKGEKKKRPTSCMDFSKWISISLLSDSLTPLSLAAAYPKIMQ